MYQVYGIRFGVKTELVIKLEKTNVYKEIDFGKGEFIKVEIRGKCKVQKSPA